MTSRTIVSGCAVILIFFAALPCHAEAPFPQAGTLSLRVYYPALVNNSAASVSFAADTTTRDSLPIPDTGTVSKSRLAVIGGVLFSSMLVIHIYQQNGWWRDNRAPFHFQEDLVYGLTVDKFGHFFGANLLQYSISRCLRWANVSNETAMWLGSGGSLLFQTYVEVEDGFSTWGFDRVDWASDLAGALWAPAQYHLPLLRAVDMKLSYHPSDLLGTPGGSGFKGQKHLMIDDYEGQTIWFTLKVHDVLPEAIRSSWPDFLGVALGYGARDIAGPRPYRVYFLAPDLDMTRIIPQHTAFLKTLGEVLNFIHLPLPAVQIYPGSIWYGLYF